MLKDNTFLIIAPLAAIGVLFCLFYVSPSISLKSLTHSSKVTSLYNSDGCSECPSFVTSADCSNPAYPVLGGLDVVQYFTEFKNSDGSYDETKVGAAGSQDYSSVYDGYTFYFKSNTNKELFDAAPARYAPQYGGFCSWGVAGEMCPDKPWTGSCLGPSGNWGHWTIQEGKLFFFLFDNAKANFMADSPGYVLAGDDRWSSWFSEDVGGDSNGHFSTRCFVSSTDGKPANVGNSIHTPKGTPF